MTSRIPPQQRRLFLLLALLVAASGAFVASDGWRKRLREESAHSRRVVAAAERDRAAHVQSAARRRELAARLQTDPHDVTARLELARLVWPEGGPRAAAKVLEAAPPPVDARLARLLAGAQRLMGREDLALRTLQRGLRDHPTDGDLYSEQAMQFALLGWFPDARKSLRQAERHGADPLGLTLVKATMARQQGDQRAARRELQAARRLHPEHGEIVRQLAAVAAAGGQRTEAAGLLAELVEREADPEALTALAQLHLDRGDPAALKQAREANSRALALRPGLPSARLLLGRSLRLSGEREQAREVLERLYRERPRHDSLAFELAQVYRELGERERAAPLLAQHQESVRRRETMRRAALAVMTRPESAAAHREIGRLCAERGLMGRAIVSLERARSLDPALPGVQTALAEARRRAEAGRGVDAPASFGGSLKPEASP